MGYDRHDLDHRLAIRPRADFAALASAARRLGLARPLRVWAAGWARRALHPLAHPRNPRVSQCRKTEADTDQRAAAPTAGLGPAGARRRRDLEQLLLPAALYPDLRRQDAASARLYHLRRHTDRGHHPRRLLGHCRALFGPDQAAYAADADHRLAVFARRLSVILADGRLSLARHRDIRCRLPQPDQGGSQRRLAVGAVGAVSSRNAGFAS